MYGVDAMSRSLFAKPARDLGLAESALVAGLIRAPSALSPWCNWEGARERSHVVLRAHARGGLHHRRRRARRRAARGCRITAHPARGSTRAPATRRTSCGQQFRERVGDDHPADWQVHTTFLPAVQAAAERRWPAGCAASASRTCRRRWSRSIRARATCWPWWAAATSPASPFNRAVRSRRQPGSAFKPFVYAAALSRGLLAGQRPARPARRHRDGQPGGVDAAQLRRRCARRADPARGPLHVEQPGGGGAAAARGQRRRAARGSGPGPARPARRAVAGPGHRPGHAARADRRLRRLPERRLRRGAARDRGRDGRGRRRRVPRPRPSPAACCRTPSPSRPSRCCATSSTSAPARPPGRWACACRPAARPGPPTISRTPGSWASRARWWRACGSGFDQPATIDDEGYGARVALPIWADFMRRTARAAAGGGLRAAVRAATRSSCAA